MNPHNFPHHRKAKPHTSEFPASWLIYPEERFEDRSKFTLDSKAPDLAGYEEFLNGEVRYNALARFNPEKAKVLFAKNEEEAKARYAYLQKLVTLYGSEE